MYISRIIGEKLRKTLAQKSVILLGARQTGKSSLIRHEVAADRVVNLLDQATFLNLSRRLSTLRESLSSSDKVIVIDEIQKLPQLMDEVHLMIEEQRRIFLLTGSSARKLNRSHTKLMAGRARSLRMHPLVSAEIPDYDLARVLSFGCLPSVYLSQTPYDDLIDYVGDYLQQEILAEALTRGIDQYSRFFTQVATCATQILNIEKLASDAQLSPTTVRRYMDILSDTLIAEQLEPWRKGRKRKAIASTKLIFFDVGVCNALMGIKQYSGLDANAGWQFEQFIGQELLAFRDYCARDLSINFWRSTDKQEVDFVLGDSVAIEVKHTSLVSERDLKGLLAIQEENRFRRLIAVSKDPQKRKIGEIEIIPFRDFLQMLWNNEIVK